MGGLPRRQNSASRVMFFQILMIGGQSRRDIWKLISEGMKNMDERTRIRSSLVRAIAEMGYPEAFGMAVADNLRTEKMMSRMIGYLRSAKPRSAEEIADEMLAIMEDRERWIRKKSAEYYNSKYNEFLYYGFGENPDEEQDAD